MGVQSRKKIISPQEGALSGRVNLQSRQYQGELVIFELRQPGQTTPLKSFNIFTGTDGSYAIANISPGTYDLTAKSSNTLRAKKASVSGVAGQVTSNIDFNLLSGDVDNNNIINAFDNSILNGAFGSVQGSPGWDARADFDNNKAINAFDNSILNGNFGKTGAQ